MSSDNETCSFEEILKIRKKKIALVKLWDGIPCAEHEVISRIKHATRTLGIECIEILPNGRCYKSNREINFNDVDFAIHLHFDTPKNYDIFSFVTLWNPVQFLFDFQYHRSSTNLLSHDDFLSCLSLAADNHINRLIHNKPLHLSPRFKMFHSLSGPIFLPKKKERKLFYIGVNWEKLSYGKSRHENLLVQLDKTGFLRIYGPKIVNGIDIWKGFKSYSGEIPFDGESVVMAINEVGAGLVLSSDSHKEDGIMSNRLFESIAAGAVVICDENSFAENHFGDSLLYVDLKSVNAFSKINEYMKWMNENPEEALKKVTASQKIFKEKFLLCESIKEIYKNLEERLNNLSFSINSLSENLPKVLLISFLISESSESIDDFISSCVNQDYNNLLFIIVVDDKFSKIDLVELGFKKRNLNYRVLIIKNLIIDYLYKMGSLVSKILVNLENEKFDYFLFFLPCEKLFHNHISSLIRMTKLEKSYEIFSVSAVIENNGIASYTQNDCNFTEEKKYSVYLANARFLFSRSVLNKSVHFFLCGLNKKFLSAFMSNRQICVSYLVTLRLILNNDYFSVLENHFENQIVSQLLFNQTVSVNHIRCSSKSQIFEKIIKIIKRKRFPVFLRVFMRKIYYKFAKNILN